MGHKSIFTKLCRCKTDTSNLSGLVVWPATHHAQKDCDPKGSWSVFSYVLLPTCCSTWPQYQNRASKSESTAGGLNWRMQVKQSYQQLRLPLCLCAACVVRKASIIKLSEILFTMYPFQFFTFTMDHLILALYIMACFSEHYLAIYSYIFYFNINYIITWWLHDLLSNPLLNMIGET